MPLSRRALLGGVAAATAAGLITRRCAQAAPCRPPTARPAVSFDDIKGPAHKKLDEKFLRWLRTRGVAKDQAVKNLVYNFVDPVKQRGSWVYPMLCGKAILWFLQRGSVDEARVMADSLLRWQQTRRDGKLLRTYGAFPSAIDKDDKGVWRAGDRYYSGDNLVILEAYLALHSRTKDPEYLNAAIGIGTWLTEIMCRGHEFGQWAEDHGAPMWFATLGGDFSNRIYGQVEMLWIGSLIRLGAVAKEQAYCRQAERAYAFYRHSQTAKGAFLDHYEPGFPPKPYDAGNWKTYQANQVISDNVLRAALGACRFGDLTTARKFYAWLKPKAGGIPAYINVETGTHGFEPNAKVYYDVVASGMHRSLCQWLGEREQAAEDMRFLERTQQQDGAWFWGVREGKLQPVEPQLAPMVGFWATADLSAPIG